MSAVQFLIDCDRYLEENRSISEEWHNATQLLGADYIDLAGAAAHLRSAAPPPGLRSAALRSNTHPWPGLCWSGSVSNVKKLWEIFQSLRLTAAFIAGQSAAAWSELQWGPAVISHY